LPRFDNAQLFSSTTFRDGIVGLAAVSTMCQGQYSAAVCQMTRGSDPLDALVCAHEMGHNFGMEHDSIGNACSSQGFIMAPYAGSVNHHLLMLLLPLLLLLWALPSTCSNLSGSGFGYVGVLVGNRFLAMLCAIPTVVPLQPAAALHG